MKKFNRAIALLLAACLVADPVTAVGLHSFQITQWRPLPAPILYQSRLQTEALNPFIELARLTFLPRGGRSAGFEEGRHSLASIEAQKASYGAAAMAWMEPGPDFLHGFLSRAGNPAPRGEYHSTHPAQMALFEEEEAQKWLLEREESGLSNYPLTLQVEAPQLWEVVKARKLVIPSKSDGTIYVWSTEQLKHEMKGQYAQKHYDEAMVSIIQIDENGPIGILDRMNPNHRAIVGGDFRKDRQREWARAVMGLATEFLDFSRFFGIPVFGLTQYISKMAQGTFALPTREFKDALVEWVGGFGRTVYWGFGKEKTEFLPVFRGREKPFEHEDLTYARVSMPRILQTKEIDGPGGVKQTVSVYDQVPNKELWKYPGGNMHFVARANARRIHSDKNAVVITNADMCDLNCHVAAQHQKPDDVKTLWVRDEKFNDGKDLSFTGAAFDEKLAALRALSIQEVRRVNGKEQVVDVLSAQAEEKKSVDVFVGDETFIKALGLESQFSKNEQAFFVVDFAAREIAVSKLVGKEGGGRQSGLYSMQALDGAIKTVMDAVQEEEGVAVTISDHGGMDEFDTPGHSGADVPFFALDFKGKVRKILKIADKGYQSDAAPTLLEMMCLKKFPKMTGTSAIREEGYQGRQGVPAVFFIHDGLALGDPKNPNNVAHEALMTGYMPYFQEMFAQAPVVPAIPSAGRKAGLRGGVGKQFEGQVETRKDVLERVENEQAITAVRMIEVDMNEEGTLLYGDPQTLQRPEALRDLRQSPFLNDREFVIRETKEPGVLEVLYFDPTQLGSTEFNLATFGTGQIVEQDILLLDRQFKSGEIFKTPAMQAELKLAKQRGYHVEHQIFQEAIKGVHASMRHQYYKLQYFKAQGVDKFVFFGSPDGRDENPEQGVSRIEELEGALAYFGIPTEDYTIHVAAGREISYDRAERYDLVEMFLNILTYGSRVIPAAAKAREEKRIREERLDRATAATRKPIIAGNWKIAKEINTEADARALAQGLIDRLPRLGKWLIGVTIMIAPTFLHIPAVSELLNAAQTSTQMTPGFIALGAQDMAASEPGANTGRTSYAGLRNYGVKYVILGHSEMRRGDLKLPPEQRVTETSEAINLKVIKALEKEFVPVACLGETKEERQSGQMEEVLKDQFVKTFANLTPGQMKNVVIAYEPVWAINTGLTATPDQAREAHRFIRGLVLDYFGDEVAGQVRILYGGSVKAGNARQLMREPGLDGVLVGGASLNADEFTEISTSDPSVSRSLAALLKSLGTMPELPWSGEQRFIARARAYLSETEAEKEISTLQLTPSQLREQESGLIGKLEKYVALKELQKAGLETLLSAPASSLLLPAELLQAFADKKIKTICDVLLLSDAEVEALAGLGPAVGPEPHKGRRFVVELRKAIYELELWQRAGVTKEDGTQKPRVVVADSIKVDQLGVPVTHDLSKISDKVKKVAALIRSNPTILIVRSATTVYENLIQQMPNLREIIRAGHGTDNVKVGDAEKDRVHVSRTGGSEASVTAWTLRGAARAIQGQAQFEQDIVPPSFYSIPEWKAAFEKKAPKEGILREELEKVWEDMFRAIGSETIESLKEKKVGIIGFGDIGKLIAEMTKLSGMEVSIYSPTLKENQNRAVEAGYAYASPDDMYAKSHFVVLIPELHKTGPNKNVDMIGARETAILKANDDLIAVVNSARGILVNEDAMATLMQEKPGFLYIVDDVPKHPYLVKHAIYTPHIGASTEEAENGVIAATKAKLAEIMTPVIWASGASKFILAELATNSKRDISQPAKTKFAGGTKVEGFLRTEKADIVVLDRIKMLDLIKKGLVRAESLVDLYQPGISVAVRPENVEKYDLNTADGIEGAVKAVLAKPDGKIGVSTGESGTYMMGRFEGWGIDVKALVGKKIIVNPPGDPVGDSVASGKFDIGFQQTCELVHVAGVKSQALPDPIQKKTIFSAGILVASRSAYAARQVLDYMVSAVSSDADLHRRHGTEPPAPPVEAPLRAWQAQLAFWVPTLLLLILTGAAAGLGLSDHLSQLGQALLVPWIIYGAGELATVITLAGFRGAFGSAVIATPSNFDRQNPILLAHEGIGHTELGIRSEFLIRLLGPFLLAWALARQVRTFFRELPTFSNSLADQLSFAAAA